MNSSQIQSFMDEFHHFFSLAKPVRGHHMSKFLPKKKKYNFLSFVYGNQLKFVSVHNSLQHQYSKLKFSNQKMFQINMFTAHHKPKARALSRISVLVFLSQTRVKQKQNLKAKFSSCNLRFKVVINRVRDFIILGL